MSWRLVASFQMQDWKTPGESVDLWDFYGSYLVIDSSQSDCGPCRSMAETEHEFVEQMQTAGIPVRVVTLLGNGSVIRREHRVKIRLTRGCLILTSPNLC